MMNETIDMNRLNRIMDSYQEQEGALIQILLDVQQEFRWISPEAAKLVSERVNIPITQVYRVASFYKALSLTPRGEHLVKICLGTACHVRGGVRVMGKVKRMMGIEAGGTTEDMKFTLERVNCLGCCALGPMMTIDDKSYGKLSPEKAAGIIKNYE